MGSTGAALFTFNDLLQIGGYAAFLIIQGAVLTWWLGRQLGKRDEAIAKEAENRNAMELRMQMETNHHREASRRDLARVELEFSKFKSEVAVRLSLLPTRDAMEAMLVQRVAPMESDLRTLVIELARLGVDVGGHARRQQQKQQGSG